MMRWVLGILILLIVGLMAYVRLSPVNAATFHVTGPSKPIGDYPTAGSFTAVRSILGETSDALGAVAKVIENTPRTELAAGSVEEGMLTFVTRSRVFGFPDYTTVYLDNAGAEPLLVIHGRLRFGSADLGVNKVRIQGWLAELAPMLGST